ncbi:hypothetical protein LRR18_17260, partial [Mangrovimonas sp. AS39]|uniref:hypothetical protein n=1 Tax=Mangrovimonas futianensis TaxID=2895523 RepID=UPI001E46D8E6
CELWNNQSLGGWKRVTEHPELTLFDVAIEDELLSPKDYLKLFGELDIARYLGQYNFTRGFVESIYEHKLEGITLEGVIAKSKTRKEYLRSKAKTRTWLELIKKNYSKDEAEKLI